MLKLAASLASVHRNRGRGALRKARNDSGEGFLSRPLKVSRFEPEAVLAPANGDLSSRDFQRDEAVCSQREAARSKATERCTGEDLVA